MALHYPSHCLAAHINLPMVQLRLPQMVAAGAGYLLGRYNGREREGFKRSLWYFAQGSGYMIQQSTKPHTLGFGLEDSPVALLAWVYEKLHDWTDGYEWTDDEILTWVSVYQFSRAGPAASVRIYYEAMKTRDDSFKGTRYVPKVPLGISHYPKDIFVVPKSWGGYMGPVVYQAIHSRGGHFAAWETPEQLAADLRVMFTDAVPHIAQKW